MTKCKEKSCPNEVIPGKKFCRYHQSKRENTIKQILKGAGALASMVGVGLLKNIKK